MPRVIEFQGRTIELPDNASDQDVRRVLSGGDAQPLPGHPTNRVVIGRPAPTQADAERDLRMQPAPETPQPSAPTNDSVARNVGIGLQGIGAGVKHTITGPFDLAAGAYNLVGKPINWALGGDYVHAMPASEMVDRAADAVGVPSVPYDQMTPGQKTAYNVNDFGTQGLALGTVLSRLARPFMETFAGDGAPIPVQSAPAPRPNLLTQPYRENPGATVVGDTIGGVGGGVATTAANEIPDGTPGKGAVQTVAPLAGGMAASTVQNVGASIMNGLGALFRRFAPEAAAPSLWRAGPGEKTASMDLPPSPSTGASFSNKDINRAAAELQSQASGGSRQAAQNIRENAADLQGGNLPITQSETPTSGLLSRDIGLVRAETGARLGPNSAKFAERDDNVRTAAARSVESLRDPMADQGAVQTHAAAERDLRVQPAVQNEQRAEQLVRNVDARRGNEGAQFATIRDEQSRRVASERLDREIVDRTYRPARDEKNRLFDTAPGRHEELPADDVFGAIDRIRANTNDLAPGTLPDNFIQRLERLRPRIDETTGENVGGPGTANGGDLADLRKFIGPAREQAQKAGNFDLADNLDRLNSAINHTIEQAPGYAEANANYRQFADRFRPERGDEGAQFTRQIDRGGQNPDGTLRRGDTPPSETAGRFLSGPEKAQSLRRMMADSPNEQAGLDAVRDYMRSDFGHRALNPDGTLNPRQAAAWARNNADVLAEFPALRQEFDGYVQTAQRGEQMSEAATATLNNARNARRQTEAEVDRGAIGALINEDPRDVAERLLSGKHGADKEIDRINAVVANDEAAKRGWKAAVSEVLTKRVTNAKGTGEGYEVRYARLAQEFKDNEGLLSKVYAPEEMNALRQVHKMLEPFKMVDKRATTGSNTADKLVIPIWMQLGIRQLQGDLKGGGIIKRMKLMLESLPKNRQGVDELTNMAWFNPDVAAYLLDKPIRNPIEPQYNINLRRLIAGANASRNDR